MSDTKQTLGEERRQRLAAAMREAGIDHLVLYGNAWQGDYLRYGADFGILEGHGIALIDGRWRGRALSRQRDRRRARRAGSAGRARAFCARYCARGGRAARSRRQCAARRGAAALPAALARRSGAQFRSGRRDRAGRQTARCTRARARSRRCAAPPRSPTRPTPSF